MSIPDRRADAGARFSRPAGAIRGRHRLAQIEGRPEPRGTGPPASRERAKEQRDAVEDAIPARGGADTARDAAGFHPNGSLLIRQPDRKGNLRWCMTRTREHRRRCSLCRSPVPFGNGGGQCADGRKAGRCGPTRPAECLQSEQAWPRRENALKSDRRAARMAGRAAARQSREDAPGTFPEPERG